jgi:hypothetical protein
LGARADQEAARALAAMRWRVSRSGSPPGPNIPPSRSIAMRMPRRASSRPLGSGSAAAVAGRIPAARLAPHDAVRNPGSSGEPVGSFIPNGPGRLASATRVSHAASPRPPARRSSGSTAVIVTVPLACLRQDEQGPLRPAVKAPVTLSRRLAALSARRWYAHPVEGGCLLQSPSRGHVGYGWRYEVL